MIIKLLTINEHHFQNQRILNHRNLLLDILSQFSIIHQPLYYSGRISFMVLYLRYLGIQIKIKNSGSITTWYLFTSSYARNFTKIGWVFGDKSCLDKISFERSARKLRFQAYYVSIIANTYINITSVLFILIF